MRVRLKGHGAVAAAFTAHRAVRVLLVERFEQAVALQPRPPSLRVPQHFRIRPQPPHHVEEAFGAFGFALFERLVTQIPNLIQIRDFREPLRFTDNFDSADLRFTVNLLQFSRGHVENAALADLNRLVRLGVQGGDKLRSDARGLLQVLFFAENVLVKLDVDEGVLKLACLLPERAYDYAEKQVAAACVIHDNRQLLRFLSQ
jgi:hypothetical protein